MLVTCVAAACRFNPGFDVKGADDSGDGETGATGGSTSAETGVTGTTAAGPCEPVQSVEDNGCMPWDPFTSTPVDIANRTILADRGCDPVTLRVQRVSETEIRECPDECDMQCDPSRSIELGDFIDNPTVVGLLPPVGTCAYLKHFGEPGTNPCRSEAYAAWDANDGSLYFAVSSGPLEIFDTTPEVPFSLSSPGFTPCQGVAPGACSDGLAKIFDVHLELGECTVDALQGQTWTELRHEGNTYEFTLDSAYDCLNFDDEDPNFSWTIRRQ
jgi:hypothetical protein